ncbi:hypothetical protein E2562_027657 [Oryza meyeriana var. granulata]|uniref:Uncharacterized protein n=1 Tax=Oryza meyeriana var. granulata TaxID=110450 RepID=A0A6G1E2T7_9ORYZ|nr:hypothetical protein E2562_027657 [Oryza meyeriana var. granulata]
MLSDRPHLPLVFNNAESSWNPCRLAPGPTAVLVASSGSLVLYHAPDTGALVVANPLTGATRALPAPQPP